MTSQAPWADLLEVAIAAARAAGQHAARHVDRRDEIDERRPHDLKLRLDVEAQEAAESAIRDRYPEHGILGEEGASAAADDQPEWIIDPIDGTVNFAYGFPCWCSSVAVRVGGAVGAGAVYVPPFDECYTATVDGPALCNGVPIAPSDTGTLADAMIYTSFGGRRLGTLDRELAGAFADRCRKVRIVGSAAINVCHVAAGRGDAYVEQGIYLWDIAAAGLIAERSGARTRSIPGEGDHRQGFVCTNRHLETAVATFLEEHDILPGP